MESRIIHHHDLALRLRGALSTGGRFQSVIEEMTMPNSFATLWIVHPWRSFFEYELFEVF